MSPWLAASRRSLGKRKTIEAWGWRFQGRACAASAESVPRRGRPLEGGFRKVKITPSPIPECLHFFGSGLMGGATSR